MTTKILIVDDEKNIRSTLARTLAGGSAEILTAVSGEEAIQVLDNEPGIEVMLLDMKLPGMDGIEVLTKLQHLQNRPAVIMITAYGTVRSAVDAMKLGAVDYLAKPFSPQQVRVLIDNVLSRKNMKPSDAVDYTSCIQLAKKEITNKQYSAADQMLRQAISFNPESPEALNLLGVLRELTGKYREAQKFYRASLSMDPTYQPAEANLMRITEFQYSRAGIDMGSDGEEK